MNDSTTHLITTLFIGQPKPHYVRKKMIKSQYKDIQTLWPPLAGLEYGLEGEGDL